MKKFLSFAAFAMLMVATCLSFAACGDDDDDEGGGKSQTSPEKFKVIDPTVEDIEDFRFWGDISSSENVNEGETKTYYVVCRKADGETWYRPSGIKFSCDNENVATVEKKGEGIVVLTAKSTGKVTLTAKMPNSTASRSISINVIGKKPKSVDEARQMLLNKYWTTDAFDELPSDLTFKMRLNPDGTITYYYYVKAFPEPTTQWWKDYAGKTVAYKAGEFTLEPDKKDPTQGTFVYVEEIEGITTEFKYRNLCATSFEQIPVYDLDDEEASWMLYTRTTAPAGVINIKNPW